MKRPYLSHYKSYQFRIDQLCKMGLIINDENLAFRILKNYSYLRFRSYSKYLEISHKKYKPETSFEEIIETIKFDEELKLLIWQILSHFEIAFKEIWSETLSKNHGVFAYQNISLFNNITYYELSMRMLNRSLIETKNPYLRYKCKKYHHNNLPSSIIKEAFTFGQLSKLHGNMKYSETTQEIANEFMLNDRVFKNWLNHFVDLRNKIAHHEIIFNSEFDTEITPLKNNINFNKKEKSLYNSLVALSLISNFLNNPQWKFKLNTLLNSHPHLLPAMGFPPNWRDKPLWQNIQN